MGKDDAILNAFKEDQTVEKISTDRKLRVGIIGCGWIADAHIKAYLAQPDVELWREPTYPRQGRRVLQKHGIEGKPAMPPTRNFWTTSRSSSTRSASAIQPPARHPGNLRARQRSKRAA